MMAEKACEGGRTIDADPCGDFVECLACGRQIRWDMTDHPFWGFQTCPEKAQTADAVDPSAADPGTPTTRE